MLGACTAAAGVTAYRLRALVARQNSEGSHHKCMDCTRGTKIQDCFLDSGASIYSGDGVLLGLKAKFSSI